MTRCDEASSPSLPIHNGRWLSRREGAAIIRRIARRANASLPEAVRIQVTPYVLRHSFLRKLIEAIDDLA
jgi:site-specific recombinase XerD